MTGIDWEALREFGRQELEHARKCSDAILAGKLSGEEAAAFTEKAADEADARRIAAGWSDEAAALALDAAGGQALRDSLFDEIMGRLNGGGDEGP